MTSLVSYLLSGQVPARPRGCRVHTVTMESKNGHKRSHGIVENSARAEKTRLANIERIYTAVQDGSDTIAKVSETAGLSITTTQKGLIALEQEWNPPRIVRERGRSAHVFKIAGNQS